MRTPRTLTAYLLREVLTYTLLGLAAIVVVLVTRNLIRTLEDLVDAGFTLQALPPGGIVREVRGKDLDSDGAVQANVFSFINLPHTAGAQSGEDFVGAEFGSGIKRHS